MELALPIVLIGIILFIVGSRTENKVVKYVGLIAIIVPVVWLITIMVGITYYDWD